MVTIKLMFSKDKHCRIISSIFHEKELSNENFKLSSIKVIMIAMDSQGHFHVRQQDLGYPLHILLSKKSR